MKHLLKLLTLPSLTFAQYGNFESKMTSLTIKVITVIMPALSILGLVYCMLLGLSGNAEAKHKAGIVIMCSIFGFIAPALIRLLQSAIGL